MVFLSIFTVVDVYFQCLYAMKSVNLVQHDRLEKKGEPKYKSNIEQYKKNYFSRNILKGYGISPCLIVHFFYFYLFFLNWLY